MAATLNQQTQTVVRNTHSAPREFLFLPPHGVTLAVNETMTIDGDLFQLLASLPRKTKYKAMKTEIAAGRLTIVSRPVNVTPLPE